MENDFYEAKRANTSSIIEQNNRVKYLKMTMVILSVFAFD